MSPAGRFHITGKVFCSMTLQHKIHILSHILIRDNWLASLLKITSQNHRIHLLVSVWSNRTENDLKKREVSILLRAKERAHLFNSPDARWVLGKSTKVSLYSIALLTLAAYLMGCIQQPHTRQSVIEMHINLLFHGTTADTCRGKKHFSITPRQSRVGQNDS